MNIFHNYKQSLMEGPDYEGGRATIHYQTHWTKEPMQKTYRFAKHMSDDELKAQHYKLFGGSVTKIERDHEYEPKKEKIYTTDKPGHLMDDVDTHVKPALDEEAWPHYIDRYRKGGDSIILWQAGHYNYYTTKGTQNPEGRFDRVHKFYDKDHLDAHQELRSQGWELDKRDDTPKKKIRVTEQTLSEGVHVVLINRHTGQRVVIKREHAEMYPPREGWQPFSSVQTESTEIVNDTPKHLMTFKTTDEKGNSRHMHIYQKNDSNWYEIKGPVAMHANAAFLNGKIGDFEAEQIAHEISNMVGNGETDRALELLNKHSTMMWNKAYDQPPARAYNAPSHYADQTYKMNEQLSEEKYYLVGMSGQNLTGHTSRPHFNSEDEAREYQKTFKHAPAIKTAKIVKGVSDKHGFITPINEQSFSRGRSVISSKLKTMSAMKNVQIPSAAERRAEFDKQQREKEAEQEKLGKPKTSGVLAKEETDRMSMYVQLINQDVENSRF